ncbi:pirin family protein [Acinetobacter sp. C26M]|uniref:pirin family protein n=1 Tax=unclassified Acinetobacter TaxID=196816 RepID=UPI0020372666|nr:MULTISPECIES: pirin family protein [unclassified Acinetobacter]USA46759.1 pirin family protein [Acinetobacter sp. C26M]USA50243.1 pirin family protein [Acinetobacter sp. C26G]
MKKILGVYQNKHMHWVGDGFPVYNLFSYDRLGQSLSPFLLLDYAAPYRFDPTTAQHGVGSHPHRGFETVTIAYKGEVTHKDSSGGGGTIKAGDVQWMTAGGGILHQEFHSPEFAHQGGLFEMVQLWVNLPAHSKMTPAKYQAIEADQIQHIKLDDAGSEMRVIAGQYQDTAGAATTFSPVNVWDGTIVQGQEHTFYATEGHTALLVLLSGQVILNESQSIEAPSLVVLSREEIDFSIKAEQDSKFLILTGQPLNEPIEGYGPFVMNSKAEIVEAVRDFNSGKFGSMEA